MIDGAVDWHTHSIISDGAGTPEQMAAAAGAAKLTGWGLSDHARSDSTWVPDYIRTVRALRVENCEIRCGLEVKILDSWGRLDLPPGPLRLDYLLLADHQIPGPNGPEDPRAVWAALACGDRECDQVIEQVVRATAAAIRNCPYPAIVAHVFSVLPKCGLSEDYVPDSLLHVLADACLAADAAVEINEKWRCPSKRVATVLSGGGVRLVRGSDAHHPDQITRCDDTETAIAVIETPFVALTG